MCTLEGKGFVVKLEIMMPASPGYVRVNMGLFSPHVNTETGVFEESIADILRLIDYFRSHMKSLAQNEDSDSYEFVTLEDCYIFKASEGYIDDDGEGEFWLRFMCKHKIAPADSICVGLEGNASTSSVERFCKQLELALHQVSQRKG